MARHGKVNGFACIAHSTKTEKLSLKKLLLLDQGYSLCFKRHLYHCKFVGPTFEPISSVGVNRTWTWYHSMM